MQHDRTRDWLIEHASKIGSTAASTLAGANPYQTIPQLYDSMVGAADGIIPPPFNNCHTLRGLMTEEINRALLSDKLGLEITSHDQNQFVYNPNYTFARALPDAKTRYEGEEVTAQFKCPTSINWHKQKLYGFPNHYYVQSQHTMAVLGTALEIFSVLDSQTMALQVKFIERDQDFIDGLMILEADFSLTLQQRKRPDELETETQALTMPPYSGEVAIFETEQARDAVQAYLTACELLKEAEELKAGAAQNIKNLIGDAEVADLPGLRVYHRQSKGSMRFDTKAALLAGLDLSPYYAPTKPFRSFRTYALKND